MGEVGNPGSDKNMVLVRKILELVDRKWQRAVRIHGLVSVRLIFGAVSLSTRFYSEANIDGIIPKYINITCLNKEEI